MKRKEDFEKYVTENGSTQKEKYNYKRYLMDISAIRYRGVRFSKWIMVIIVFITLYNLMS